MRKILITGGAGNIGSSLANRLAKDNNTKVIVVDNLITGNIKKLANSKNILFIKLDVNNYDEISSVMLSNELDYVFHYAALVGVKRTLENPYNVLNDIDGIRNVLNLSKNTGVKKVFYSSSSEVYGEPVELPQFEDTTPLNSRLPYAIVKNVGEAFFRTYKSEYGLNYTIFRFFNTYGPSQSTDFVMSKFIALALENKDIQIFGDGLQTRTFCYIDDNLDTIESILNNNYYSNEVINIGNDREITIIDLAKKVISMLNSKSKIVHIDPLKDGDMTRRKPDITKMKKVLMRELTSIEDGILKTLELRAKTPNNN